MSDATLEGEVLRTSVGDFPLLEFRAALAGREMSILHTNALLSHADEADFLMALMHLVPYGVALWPSSIALAHEIAARAEAFRGRSVLELGAGTGLPGIAADAVGARVVQTERHAVAMEVCRRNAARNGAHSIEHRLADWEAWEDRGAYDWIIASDVLYGEAMHPHLRRIFAANLAPGGRVLLADPFRAAGLRFLEALEAEGWAVRFSRWGLGEGAERRSVGVFDLLPPDGRG